VLQASSLSSPRPYQEKGTKVLIRDIIRHAQALSSESLGEEISKRIHHIQNLHEDFEGHRPSKHVWLVAMTMGSGKTRVLWEVLRRILRLRNKFLPERSLNILVLSDRINLVDQLQGDLVSWRDGKTGMLASVITQGNRESNIQSVHSQNTDKKLELQQKGDNIILSTIQSVQTITGNWDIVIVDEADSVLTPGKREVLLSLLEAQETLPYILGFTGTVDENLVDILGDPLFSYGLDDYLRSEYAPDLYYHLMTANTVSAEEVNSIHACITRAKEETDLPKKKKLEREIRIAIEAILARFDGYTAVVEHLTQKSGIDLSKRTLLFVPSITEADDVTRYMNENLQKMGVPYRAKALHSKTEESDLRILQEFREDNHLSILVTVNKLNRGTDIPTIENIISLRDTQSKRVFLQQIGRWMRGDLTRIFDYTPSLTNLIWMQDILRAKSKKKNRESTGSGSDVSEAYGGMWDGTKRSGFMIGTNTLEVDSSLIDFFALVWVYVEHTEVQKELLTPEDWIQALAQHGVTQESELRKKWVVWFQKTFGVSDIGKMLGRTIRHVSVQDLQELAEQLGWEEQKELLTPDYWIQVLAQHGVTQESELRKKWAMWFQKTFGLSDIGKMLGRTIRHVSVQDLKELAEQLGWEVQKELLTPEDWIQALAQHGVTQESELRKKW
jgi:superfamily II DNA or RNA helicase